MIRTLLTTTALVAVMTTGAFAADTEKKSDMNASGVGAAIFTMEPSAQPMESVNGYFAASEGQILATTLIGKELYNGNGENAESIGEVNDVVLAPNGTAEAVVVAVGGFLGIGEKDVAVDFERIGWTERDGERWLTISATQEELESAPAFDRSAFMIEKENSVLGSDMSEADKERMTTAMNNEAAPAGETAGTPADSQPMAQSDDPHNEQIVVDAQVASADELIGTPVYGANEEHLGEVSDVIVSDAGQVEAYILDVGGFLGIGEKPVALDARNLEIKKDSEGGLHIYTGYTQEELEGFPEYSEDAYRTNPDAFLSK